MREWAYRITVVALLSLIALALYLHAENGRYQFIKTDSNEIVIDTRTGEYWVDATTHIDPRGHRVTQTNPAISEQKRP